MASGVMTGSQRGERAERASGRDPSAERRRPAPGGERGTKPYVTDTLLYSRTYVHRYGICDYLILHSLGDDHLPCGGKWFINACVESGLPLKSLPIPSSGIHTSARPPRAPAGRRLPPPSGGSAVELEVFVVLHRVRLVALLKIGGQHHVPVVAHRLHPRLLHDAVDLCAGDLATRARGGSGHRRRHDSKAWRRGGAPPGDGNGGGRWSGWTFSGRET